MFYLLVFAGLFVLAVLLIRDHLRVDAQVERIRREHARRLKELDEEGWDDPIWKED